MNYYIPALDAKVEVEKKFVLELGVFCEKMKIVESQMHKALRTVEKAQKTFASNGAAPNKFCVMESPVMAHQLDMAMTELLQ